MGLIKCEHGQCSEEFDLNDVQGPIQDDYVPLCYAHSNHLPYHLRPIKGSFAASEEKRKLELEPKV